MADVGRAVVIHAVNGTTKTAIFTGPIVTWTPVGEALGVEVQDADRNQLGNAVFLAGMVALRGVCIDQYQPLSKIEDPDVLEDRASQLIGQANQIRGYTEERT